MGGWFRDRLGDLGLFERNALLRPDQVHFIANNMQRTVATARSFATGFMPEADVVVEHLPFGTSRDSRFTLLVPRPDAVLAKRLERGEPRLTFVGGHDTTLAQVGTQLDVEPYELPGAVEYRTPIGSKIVLGRWRCDDGIDRVSVDFVYQTTAQIRACQPADRAHPPSVVRLRLKGLTPDADGRFPLADILPRLLSPDPGP